MNYSVQVYRSIGSKEKTIHIEVSVPGEEGRVSLIKVDQEEIKGRELIKLIKKCKKSYIKGQYIML